MAECSSTIQIFVGLRLIAVTETSDFAPALSKEMLKIQTTEDRGFNQKFVRDMRETYSPMHCEDKYSHLS